MYYATAIIDCRLLVSPCLAVQHRYTLCLETGERQREEREEGEDNKRQGEGERRSCTCGCWGSSAATCRRRWRQTFGVEERCWTEEKNRKRLRPLQSVTNPGIQRGLCVCTYCSPIHNDYRGDGSLSNASCVVLVVRWHFVLEAILMMYLELYHDLTKRFFILRSLYKQKSVLL